MSNFKPYPIDTLDDCARHYVEPDKQFINCKEFGHSDGMNGGCWYCMEFTPYQFYMCRDAKYLESLMSHNGMTKEEAMQFIEQRMQKYPHRPHAVYMYELYLKNRVVDGRVKALFKRASMSLKDKLYRTYNKKKINERDKKRYNQWIEDSTKDRSDTLEF